MNRRSKSEFLENGEEFVYTATRACIVSINSSPAGTQGRCHSVWQRLFLCRGRETRGGLPGWGNKTLPHWAAHSPPRVEEDMLDFEHIFRHDCRILATKILVSDFYPLYGEASTQVPMACTRLCMFRSLLGKVFRSELRKPLHLPATWYTSVPFDHLWSKNIIRSGNVAACCDLFWKIRKTHGEHF